MTLDDFKVGDVLLFTQRSKRGEEKRVGLVTAINYNGLGRVTFTGAYGYNYLPTGSGSFKPEEVGTKPYGFHCAVEIIGHERPQRPWQPKPGDPGFDPMH